MDNKVWLIDIIGMLFSAIISVVITNLGLPVYTSVCVGIILFLIMVLVQLIIKYKKMQDNLEQQKRH